MIPNNNKCPKQQEDSRPKIIKEPQMRITQISMAEYCPHLHNPMENFLETYQKFKHDFQDSHNFIGVQADQCFYDHNKNWYYSNNNNCYDDFYAYNNKIKREEDDEPRFWSPQIKDQQSPSMNQEHAFQACEIPKQQEFQCVARGPFDDPTKFLGSYITASRQQKNNQRKLKVQAYWKKKSMRSFEKKIIYKCRKQVADNRIRYRGRFISVNQAAQILKLDAKGSYNSVQLMQKLKALNQLDIQKDQKQNKENTETKQKQKQVNTPCQQIVKKIQQEL